MIDIIPGILEKDFDKALDKINLVRGIVNWLQIDILDNTLIPNTTFREFGAFREIAKEFNLEAHLMVADPAKYVAPLAKAGFKRLIAQVEGDTVREFIEAARLHEGVEVGVAIDAPTKLEVIEPYLEIVDSALVMMYPMGFSGQTFQPAQLVKIKAIKSAYKDLPIEVDGGIDKDTAPLCIGAGATRLVSTSFLFWKNADRIAQAIEELRSNS